MYIKLANIPNNFVGVKRKMNSKTLCMQEEAVLQK